MNKKTIYRLSDNWNLHKEELKEKKFYLFNIDDGDIIRLNEVSFDILSNIDGNRTMQEIFEVINDIYDVDENILWNDMLILINKCIEKKVLVEL